MWFIKIIFRDKFMNKYICIAAFLLVSIVIPCTADEISEVAPVFKNITDSLIDKDGEEIKNTTLSNKEYVLFYYSARWSDSCKIFTPKLVKFYNENEKDRKFEIIFVSIDHSASEMQKYMKEMSMPWPAVKYDNIKKTKIRQYVGRNIPCLVMFNQKGEVISNTYKGEKYIDPTKVLNDLTKLMEETQEKEEALIVDKKNEEPSLQLNKHETIKTDKVSPIYVESQDNQDRKKYISKIHAVGKTVTLHNPSDICVGIYKDSSLKEVTSLFANGIKAKIKDVKESSKSRVLYKVQVGEYIGWINGSVISD